MDPVAKKTTTRKKDSVEARVVIDGVIFQAKSSDHMRELGRRRWANVSQKKKKVLLSRAAKMSHKINNPDANRDGYHGGRLPSE